MSKLEFWNGKYAKRAEEARQGLPSIGSDYIGEWLRGLITSGDIYDLKTLLVVGEGVSIGVGGGEHSYCLYLRSDRTVTEKMIKNGSHLQSNFHSSKLFTYILSPSSDL